MPRIFLALNHMHFGLLYISIIFIYFYGRHTRDRGNLLTSKAHTRRQWVYKSFHATMSDFSLAQSSSTLTRGKEFSEKKRKMCINIILSLSVHTTAAAVVVVALCIYFWSPRDEFNFFKRVSSSLNSSFPPVLIHFGGSWRRRRHIDIYMCGWLYLCQIIFYFTFFFENETTKTVNCEKWSTRERENHWKFHKHNYHAQHIYKINIFLPASSSSSFPRHCWLAEV